MGNIPLQRVQGVKDLGVWFDPGLTFREHARGVAETAYRRLGFVLRHAAPLSTPAVKALYATLVRSIMESSSVVWSPHEYKHILLIEKVQKRFLRSLYKKEYKYYPYMYPTLFLQGQLGYNSLEVRRQFALWKMVINLLRGKTDCVGLNEVLLRLSVPNLEVVDRLRPRARELLAARGVRTVGRAHSPVELARKHINAVLAAAPHCDLFATTLSSLYRECLKVCETMFARDSSIAV